jgi:hypothetical protein
MLIDDLVTTAEFNRCILFEPENFDPRERDDDNIERSNLLAQSEAIEDGLETKNDPGLSSTDEWIRQSRKAKQVSAVTASVEKGCQQLSLEDGTPALKVPQAGKT